MSVFRNALNKKRTIRWPFEHVSDKEYSIINVAYIAL